MQEIIKPIIIVLVVTIYWALVYYKYHYTSPGPLTLVLGGFVVGCVGLYGLLSGKATFEDIKILYYALVIFYIICHILLLFGFKKYGIKSKVDITAEWIKRNLGTAYVFIGMVSLYFLIIFVLLGTFTLLGKDHIYLWILILGAWTVSNTKLTMRFVKNNV